MGEGEGTELAMFNDKYGMGKGVGEDVMMSPNPMHSNIDRGEAKKLKQMQEAANDEKNQMEKEKNAMERKLEQMKKELAMANNNSRVRKSRRGTKKTWDPESHGGRDKQAASDATEAIGAITKANDPPPVSQPPARAENLTNSHAAASNRFDDDDDPPMVVAPSVEVEAKGLLDGQDNKPKKVTAHRLSL